MHGVIHDALKLMFLRRFGEDKYKLLLQECESSDDDFMMFHNYPDAVTLKLVLGTCKVLGITLDQALDAYGEYFYHYAVERGFSQAMRSYGRDVYSFLSNLDYHHYFVSSFMYGSIASPSFRCEKRSDGSLYLNYFSTRTGFYPLVQGLVRESVKHIFGLDIALKYVEKIDFSASVNSKWKDGVTFFVSFTSSLGAVQNETALLHSADRPNTGEMQNFQYLINSNDFRRLFPFYFVFDRKLNVLDAGDFFLKYRSDLFLKDQQQPTISPSKVSKSASQTRSSGLSTGLKLTDCLHLVYPTGTLLTCASIKSLCNQTIIVRMNGKPGEPEREELRLSGQIMPLNNGRHMIYVCSPRFSTLAELLDCQLYLSDIAIHDATRDLVLLCDQRASEIGLSKQLEETTANLQKMSLELEKEKGKTEMLLYEILPRQIAQKLLEGKSIDAGYYKEVTILFSDIVKFTVMTALSQPIEIVTMLNQLFTRFDHLTCLNNVYKVETIGDAYMVCGGVPENTIDHAEKVASMALGMLMACKEVMAPTSKRPLQDTGITSGKACILVEIGTFFSYRRLHTLNCTQIRVGVNSGPVLAGVVGQKCPRFCLFGDTVNTASRMESHGVPDKIHASESTAKLLASYPAVKVVRRGKIQIKGKGKMVTYFLLPTATPMPSAQVSPGVPLSDTTTAFAGFDQEAEKVKAVEIIAEDSGCGFAVPERMKQAVHSVACTIS